MQLLINKYVISEDLMPGAEKERAIGDGTVTEAVQGSCG